MAGMRVFIALRLPEDVKQHLGHSIQRLAHLDRHVRWVDPKASHLTLKFLGPVQENRIVGLVQAVRQLVAGVPPVALRTAEIGAFPGPDRARVVWMGLEGDLAGLRNLREDLESTAEQMGFSRDTKAFVPHITLGRTRGKPVDLGRIAGLSDSQVHFQGNRLVVFQSDFRSGGVVYTALGSGEMAAKKDS